MSEQQGPARPRQVTMAVVMAVISSVVLVLGLFDTLGRLRTPDMREVVDEFLAEPPGSSLGLDTAQVVELMRALVFVSGALAAMALVFAIFVLQRHRGARIGLTVVAVLLVLTLPVAGLMPFFLAVAAFLLWSQPARDWYAGRAPAPAAAGSGRPLPQMPSLPNRDQPNRDQPHHDDRPAETSPTSFPPTSSPPPYGQPFAQPFAQPGGGTQVRAGMDPDKRPLSVTLAAALTWVGAGLTALLMLAFVAILSSGGDAFVEEFERAARQSQLTLDRDQVLALGWGIAGTFLVWSLVSVVLAVLAFRRNNAARYALAASAVMVALLSLVSIMSLVSVVTLVLASAAAVMLFTGGANQWFARRSDPSGHGHSVPYAQPPATPYGQPPADQYSAYPPPSSEDRVDEHQPAGRQPSGEQPVGEQPPPQQPQYQQPRKRNQPW